MSLEAPDALRSPAAPASAAESRATTAAQPRGLVGPKVLLFVALPLAALTLAFCATASGGDELLSLHFYALFYYRKVPQAVHESVSHGED